MARSSSRHGESIESQTHSQNHSIIRRSNNAVLSLHMDSQASVASGSASASGLHGDGQCYYDKSREKDQQNLQMYKTLTLHAEADVVKGTLGSFTNVDDQFHAQPLAVPLTFETPDNLNTRSSEKRRNAMLFTRRRQQLMSKSFRAFLNKADKFDGVSDDSNSADKKYSPHAAAVRSLFAELDFDKHCEVCPGFEPESPSDPCRNSLRSIDTNMSHMSEYTDAANGEQSPKQCNGSDSAEYCSLKQENPDYLRQLLSFILDAVFILELRDAQRVLLLEIDAAEIQNSDNYGPGRFNRQTHSSGFSQFQALSLFYAVPYALARVKAMLTTEANGELRDLKYAQNGDNVDSNIFTWTKLLDENDSLNWPRRYIVRRLRRSEIARLLDVGSAPAP